MENIDCSLNITAERLMRLPPRLRTRLLDFLIRWLRYEEALPIARQLAANQPEGLLYRANLARILSVLGHFDEAETIVAELENQYPQRPSTIAAFGDLEMARGDLPKALKYYLEMLKLNESSTRAWRRLAMLYLAANQLDKAYTSCKKVLSLAKTQKDSSEDKAWTHPDVLRVLLQIYKARGDDALAADIQAKLALQEKEEEDNLRSVLEQAKPVLSKSRPKPHPTYSEPPVNIEPVEPLPPTPPLHPNVLKCLYEVFGHNEFRSGQEDTVSRLLAGQDLLVVMPTGAGKSLCYQLPAALGRRVVVISPLIALMKDQVDGLPKQLAATATLINSTIESDELERRLSGIAHGRYNLIYAAPERLRQPPFLHVLRKAGVDLFVVDEVHCVSIWGHDFRPDYLFIAPALELLGNPPFCGMTATAGPAMRKEIEKQIGRKLLTVSIGTYRPNLMLEVKQVSKNLEKLRTLARICQNETGSGIIYASTRAKTEQIASYLRSAGIDAGYYHAGMEPEAREAAQEAFMSGRCRVIVATVAFGMGVDKRDVRFVAHFSLPKSLENYYQEAGRAGRDGLPSKCILFYSPGDKARLTNWTSADQMSMDHLKLVYEAIKASIPTGAGLVHDDDLQRNSGLDETTVRVAISLLERAGLIKRRLDVPINVTITVRPASGFDEEFDQFISSARLREGQKISLEAREIAERTGLNLFNLEWKLLDWRDRGWINYRSSGRTMYIERCPASKGSKKVLQDLLDSYSSAAVSKINILAAYAKTNRCRHDFIARHFGEQPVKGCKSCNNCVKLYAESHLTDDHMLILKGVISLPVRLDRIMLIKSLAGLGRCPIQPHEWPQLGAFKGRNLDLIGGLIDDLIEWKYLEQDGNSLRPLLVITSVGRKLVSSV